MSRESSFEPQLSEHLSGSFVALEHALQTHAAAIENWFRQQWQLTPAPIYGSVDLRHAAFKLAPVDTNLFPAGFNNLNPDFLAVCVQAMQATIAEKCPDITRVLIVPENHTRNQFYFENLATLQHILQRAGLETRIGTMNPEISQSLTVALPSKRQLTLEPLIREGDRIGVNHFFPCCIILNNDLSSGVPDILQNVSQRIMPAIELGWATRLKSNHFRFYEHVTQEFAEQFNFDPWLLMPYFDQCPTVNFAQQAGQQCLMERVQQLFSRIQQKYQEYNIQRSPFAVVKADQGTYGMAVMMVKKPEDLLRLNRKQRNKMSTLKGGQAVTKVIIQEGVYSFEIVGKERAVAEPVVYLIGRHVVGGFYRKHKNRGADENLNAPGMDFEPIAFRQLCYCPDTEATKMDYRFYTYGVVARLAMLAAARELKEFRQEK